MDDVVGSPVQSFRVVCTLIAPSFTDGISGLAFFIACMLYYTILLKGTKRGRYDPGAGGDDRCGIRSAASNGFSTGSMDYCMPTDEIPTRWRGSPDYYYEVYFLPSTAGALRLHVEIQLSSTDEDSWTICDIADVDVRYGGRVLITEIHYNPPDVPNQPIDTASYTGGSASE
jgi:hypothetical protein